MTMANLHDNPSDAETGAARPGIAARALSAWERLASAERRAAPCWAPVMMGLGIWIFFAAPQEPSAWLVAAAVAFPAALIPLFMIGRTPPLPVVVVSAALISAGFSAASISSWRAEAPVLAKAIDATVHGRVIEVTRSADDRRRVELGELIIYGLTPEETPSRVRVTLLEGAFARDVGLGERIEVFAHLSPPQGPVEPGGFDFRRLAWFERLGAVGFARGPLVAAGDDLDEPAGSGLMNWVDDRRGAMTQAIREALPGREGAFAAAILTGSRAEVRQAETQALRDSNLAHLLAISGLHMGLLAGLVFAVARLALAAAPGVAVRIPAKKVAAAAALAAAAGYLVLSGASVATQRAFAMAAAALIAVMIDRPAVSMRALAAAALAILLISPESMLNVGFQMSFAATAALIAVYEGVRDRGGLRAGGGAGLARRIGVYAGALALTSLVAGLATAPYGAEAFNRASVYGLPANLLAMPVMAFWVAPMGVLAGIAAPFGLHGLPLQAMGWGISAILAVAEWASSLPGAVRPVGAPPPWTLALITLGGLWLCLWRSRLRWAGAAAVAAGLVMWAGGGHRPEVLIAPQARAIGAMGPQGRAVDRARGAGYPIRQWLARDGDEAAQDEAAIRPGVRREERAAVAALSNGWQVVLLSGLAPSRRIVDWCRPRMVVVAWAAHDDEDLPAGPCLLLNREKLDALGAVSVDPSGDGVRLRGSLPETAGRAWGGGLGDGDDEDE